MSKVDTSKQAQAVLQDYEYFLFDCDGVIWLGAHVLPFVRETLSLLRNANKKIIFVTNNSTKSRSDYVKKFQDMGIEDVRKDEIFGSSFATAVYIQQILKLPQSKKIWVLGEEGIEKELQELGYETLGGSDTFYTKDGVNFDPNDESLAHLDDEVGAVVAGLTFNLNYLKLSITTQYLLKDNKSIPFIATNIDSTFPMQGKLLVGAGSIINTVAYASGREPDAVCGKPNPSMMASIMARNPGLKANPRTGIMIGDRLNTDMKFGKSNGLDTLLVLTGIETEENVKNLREGESPTYYADKLGDLFELLQTSEQ
ncbi:hypothetical protein CXQ85_004413 [Candidozyma haemuli]|uniref:4-nitrophenylphosphatase n=1 Tax=Candidozyma haemuli TaxID=45357 RepID=A0A2V1AVJ8_9ASCO|nr:hypothetical protein CXQ85_004413 [[Candida] haemuloni]PVH20901.1 hypothetical protein CXQ85_004413 [[Candida] haemuloni]